MKRDLIKNVKVILIVFFNKKASFNILWIVIPLMLIGSLIFLLISGVTNNFLSDFTDDVVNDDSFNSVAKEAAAGIKERNSGMWDDAFLILFAGLYICLLVAGFLVEEHPLILIFLFLLILVVGYIGLHIDNIYIDLLIDSSGDIDFAGTFPKAHFIMNNLSLLVIGGMILFGLGIFIRGRQGL